MNFRCSSFCRLFCVSSFLVLQVFAQLKNPCRHNEFRCEDGSKCLKAEKLCNGKRDCPKGEDERGSPQWDCTKITLSTDCDPTEIKCRYGGCISKTQQCNGVPDCWGGNDESIDLCPPNRNQNTPNTVPQQPPPPVNRRPRPPPPRPPASPTQITQPPKIQSQNSGTGCPSLSQEFEGFKIECSSNYDAIDCTNPRSSIPTGTKAVYTCKPFYRPPLVGSTKRERICQPNGSWTPLRRNFQCSLDCGIGGNDQVSLIVGGVTSREGKWPWQVALYQENPPNSGNWEYYCGGSLVSPNAVITAAHCASILRTQDPKDPRDVRLMLGKFYRSFARKEAHMQMHRAKKIVIHEEYNPSNVDNDIAIIFLEKNAEMTSRVHPVCLPDPKVDVVQPEDFGFLAGWGRSLNNVFKEELQEAQLPVISHKTCRSAHQTLASIVRSTTFCAGYRNGTSACDGDSGSALVFPDPYHTGKYKIQGIVSAGIAQPGGGCRNTYYSVFTKVLEYRDWIDQNIEIN